MERKKPMRAPTVWSFCATKDDASKFCEGKRNLHTPHVQNSRRQTIWTGGAVDAKSTKHRSSVARTSDQK
eukprot:15482055-Alexandrium_andersonii.AAC.1